MNLLNLPAGLISPRVLGFSGLKEFSYKAATLGGALGGTTAKVMGHLFQQEPSGGGGGIADATVPVAAPPVSSSDAAVIAAEQDMARQALMRKSVRHTILAGDTGGYHPGAANPANQPSAPTGFRHG